MAPPPEPPEALAVEAAVTAQDEPSLSLPLSGEGRPPVVRGAAWTIIGFVALQVIRFGANLILTRLVTPYVFGVMNLVNLINTGLHMFSDLGLRPCVVNSPRGDERRFLDTAWTLQVIRGCLLWVVTIAAASPLSRFYETPQMLWLVPLVGVVSLVEGFTASAVFTLSRRLERGKLVAREVLSYALGITVAIAWLTYLGRTSADDESLPARQMFAFAACHVLAALFELVTSYLLVRGWRNGIAWDPPAVRELAKFGGWIAVSTGCTFLASNLDRLYVGKLDKAVLANYNIAGQLAAVPTLLLMALGHQLLFPLYSRLVRDGVRLQDSFALLHAATTGFTAWLAAGALAVCPTLVRLVYPPAYHDAAGYVPWLSVAAWVAALQTSAEVTLLALGNTRRVALGQIAKLVVLAPLLIGGYQIGGILGVIVGYAIAEAVRYVILSTALWRNELPVFRMDFKLTILVAATAALTAWVGPHLEGPDTSRVSRYGVRFLGEALVLTAVWGVIFAAWWPKRGQALRELMRFDREG